jgi:hypothetical protein
MNIDTPAWDTDHDLAFRSLADAWVRADDLRRQAAPLADRHDALIELDRARLALRQTRRQATTNTRAA